MEGESTSTVDFSLIIRQAKEITATKTIAMIKANNLKPSCSSPFPSAGTQSMVITVIIAEPTPAHDRASVDNPSLSCPPSVKAGIIDQNGISIRQRERFLKFHQADLKIPGVLVILHDVDFRSGLPVGQIHGKFVIDDHI